MIYKHNYNYLTIKHNYGCGLEKERSNKACKDSNEIYIEVELQEARLFHNNMNLFCKKKKEKNKKSTKTLHRLYSCRQTRLIDGKRDRRGLRIQLLVSLFMCL